MIDTRHKMPDQEKTNHKNIHFIDLFCGIGGFRIATEQAGNELGISVKSVFSSDIDESCQRVYENNFGQTPVGDITEISHKDIPRHEILLAGFPCQAFSIIGHRRGFRDTRGTLFFEIARILEAKKPEVLLLENVRSLVGHNNGKTLKRIISDLRDLGYFSYFKVLNALDFGLPQKRERIFIVGFKNPCSFDWPKGGMPMTPLRNILEENVPEKYFASEKIRKNRLKKHSPTVEPTVWHENKSGHISSYPFSCALRAGASYNYLLVNGVRRFTPREMLRLQGFPDTFKGADNYGQARRQAGNSLPVPVAKAVLKNIFISQGWYGNSSRYNHYNLKHQIIDGQVTIFEKKRKYEEKPKIKNSRKIQASVSTK